MIVSQSNFFGLTVNVKGIYKYLSSFFFFLTYVELSYLVVSVVCTSSWYTNLCAFREDRNYLLNTVAPVSWYNSCVCVCALE